MVRERLVAHQDPAHVRRVLPRLSTPPPTISAAAFRQSDLHIPAALPVQLLQVLENRTRLPRDGVVVAAAEPGGSRPALPRRWLDRGFRWVVACVWNECPARCDGGVGRGQDFDRGHGEDTGVSGAAMGYGELGSMVRACVESGQLGLY